MTSLKILAPLSTPAKTKCPEEEIRQSMPPEREPLYWVQLGKDFATRKYFREGLLEKVHAYNFVSQIRSSDQVLVHIFPSTESEGRARRLPKRSGFEESTSQICWMRTRAASKEAIDQVVAHPDRISPTLVIDLFLQQLKRLGFETHG
jgi:hypothetical protein